MAWVYLFVAGLFEMAWAIGLKYTEGFSRLVPSLLTVAAMTLSLALLGLALKTLPVGTAYAVWTGIAGHFVGFALLYPERRVGLWIAAIGLPAILHGTYNTFSQHGFGLFVAVFSVFALNLYMARSMELDRLLRPSRSL